MGRGIGTRPFPRESRAFETVKGITPVILLVKMVVVRRRRTPSNCCLLPTCLPSPVQLVRTLLLIALSRVRRRLTLPLRWVTLLRRGRRRRAVRHRLKSCLTRLPVLLKSRARSRPSITLQSGANRSIRGLGFDAVRRMVLCDFLKGSLMAIMRFRKLTFCCLVWFVTRKNLEVASS